MNRRRNARAALLLTAAAALVAVPAASGGSPPKRVVQVADNYFAPMNLNVKKGTRVVWRWSPDNTERHDVKLVKRPRGARRFHSDPAITGHRFRRKLRVRGKYKIICTYHRVLMRQTITVK